MLYTGDDNEQVRQEIDMLGPTEPDPDNPNQYGNPASRFTEEQVRCIKSSSSGRRWSVSRVSPLVSIAFFNSSHCLNATGTAD